MDRSTGCMKQLEINIDGVVHRRVAVPKGYRSPCGLCSLEDECDSYNNCLCLLGLDKESAGSNYTFRVKK